MFGAMETILSGVRAGVLADVALRAEDLPDVGGRDRLLGRSFGRDDAVLEKNQPLGVGRGQVDVVLGGDDGLALILLQAFENAVDLGLVADIEMEAGAR